MQIRRAMERVQEVNARNMNARIHLGPMPNVTNDSPQGGRLEGEQDVRDAHVMAIKMIMTIKMAPVLPSTATAAAGGTRPARQLFSIEPKN